MRKMLGITVCIISLCLFYCLNRKPQNPSALCKKSLDLAVEQYFTLDKTFPDSLFPRTLHPDGSLRTCRSDWWVSGFFPGSLWLLYEYSGNDSLKERALVRTAAVEKEKLNASDHDIGFKIGCSFGNGLRIAQVPGYTETMLTAARTLATRFNPRVGCIQSWGPNQERGWEFPVIVDNMMNLELLFRATSLTGDSAFYHIAVSHADRTLKNHYRPDGSCWHVLSYDPETGRVEKRNTAQGFSDESAWARGQSWGLYGFVMCYRETKAERYLSHAVKIADFLLNHPNLPKDGIPYWDYDAPDIPGTYRDTSAGAIMASALLELGDYVDTNRSLFYRDSAVRMLRSLSGDAFRSALNENGNFLLKHGVGSLPGQSEVDVPLTYGDYYYIEAMLRFLGTGQS
ncbi:glycoside hydrolase family 88 protein [bacterium]|nr:glycoside hydrolase family 88 protein [bacterium]